MRNADSRLSISVFASITAIFLALIFRVLRTGFDDTLGNSVSSLIIVLGTGLFIILFSDLFIMLYSKYNSSSKTTWLLNDAVLTLSAFILCILFGLIEPFGILSYLPFVFGGYIFFVISIYKWIQNHRIKKIILLIIILSPLLLWLAGMLFSDPLNPLFYENIFIAKINKDTVFHELLASMIQNYGIPSIGIDGIKLIPYHFGSHWVLAQLSSLMNIPPITSLQMIVPIIFTPLFYKSLLTVILDTQHKFYGGTEKYTLKNKQVFLFLFVSFVVGFIPFPILKSMSPGAQSIATISYTLSMVLTFSTLSIILYVYETPDKYKYILLLIILPFLIASISITKISSGAMTLGLIVILYLRNKLYKITVYNLGIVLMTLSFSAVYIICFTSAVGPKFYESGLKPFNYYYTLTGILKYPWFSYIVFPLVQLSVPLVYIFLILHYQGIKSLKELFEKIKGNELPSVELVLIMTTFGAIPSVLVLLPQTQHYWFIDYSYWITAIFLLSFILFERNTSEEIIESVKSTLKIDNKKVLVIKLLSVLLMFSILFNTGRGVLLTIGFSVRDRSQMISEMEKNKNPLNTILTSLKTMNIKKAYNAIAGLYSTSPQEALRKSPHYNLLNTFTELWKLPEGEKKRSLIFIPQSDSLYWELLAKHSVTHRISSFIAGGISGIGMIDGMPPKDSLDWNFTGFASYKLRDRLQTEEDKSIPNLSQRVISAGFSELILINSVKGGFSIIDCGANIENP